jgi:WD40 repeat protein
MDTIPVCFSSSVDGTVKLWDIRTGCCEKTFYGHNGPILDFDISKDGSVVVTGSDDGSSLVFLTMG